MVIISLLDWVEVILPLPSTMKIYDRDSIHVEFGKISAVKEGDFE